MPQTPLNMVAKNPAGNLVLMEVDANGALITDGSTASQPSSVAGAGVAAVNSGTAAVAGLVAKSTGGNLYGGTVQNVSTVPGWAMVLNDSSVPATGTLAAGIIADASICGVGSVGGSASFGYNPPLQLGNGATLVFSSTAPPVMTTVAGSMWGTARVK